jgi:hypothetical protein
VPSDGPPRRLVRRRGRPVARGRVDELGSVVRHLPLKLTSRPDPVRGARAEDFSEEEMERGHRGVHRVRAPPTAIDLAGADREVEQQGAARGGGEGGHQG